MDCLDPPMLYVPVENWYCQQCEEDELSESEEEESADEAANIEEVNDLQREIQREMGNLPETRLRSRLQQPQIVRTLQSERIRNAILARRSRAINIENLPSTSTASTRRTSVTAKKKSPKKRKTRKRARRSTEVAEYEIKNGVKFPIKVKRKVATRKKRRKKRKVKRRVSRRDPTATSSAALSFRNANSNVYDLQRGRQLAGLSNFNIFEPSNQLDYVPDDEIEEFNEFSSSSRNDLLTQGIVNFVNPLRRQAIIKKRVIDNFVTTTSSSNLIDSILNEKNFFESPKPNGILNEKNNNKIRKATTTTTTTTTDGNENFNSRENQGESSSNQYQSGGDNSENNADNISSNNNNNNSNKDNEEQLSNTSLTATCSNNIDKKQKKKKPAVFDMFQDTSPVEEEEEEEDVHGGCPNFSIYDSVNDDQISMPNHSMTEENFDLVQMSDEGESSSNLITEDIEPALIVKSQPASPDLENEVEENDQIMEEERSYTPPLTQTTSQVEIQEDEESKKSNKKNSKDKRSSKRQELERYNVRERFREKSPPKSKDPFGRNRTRSRSRSRGRRRRSKSSSHERRHRNRHKSKSLSKKRDSSDDRKKRRNKRRKSYSRSPSPRYTSSHNHRDSRRRRERSPSEKPKKKRHRSKERTKEVYTSGQNILMSVNFQEDKRSTKSKSCEDNEPIVDITAKKKINVSSKPVAIIDLARSPFRELTPEYKKESNVIELSDSEGEKHPPKSPDSTKLYDPFDILNSPSNENVSSSQQNVKKGNPQLVSQPILIQKIQVLNEDNQVTSSSSVNATRLSNSNKIEVLQHEVIQEPNMATIESPYSPGNDDTYHHDDDHDDDGISYNNSKTIVKPNEKPTNLFDELFGSSSPPGLDRIKNSSKKCKNFSHFYSLLLIFLSNSFRSRQQVHKQIKATRARD